MTLADVDDIVEIHCAAHGLEHLEDRFRDYAYEQARGEIPDSITYVIIDDDRTVGRLRVVRRPGYIEIAGLQIHPDCQSRGFGTAVIRTILDEGRRRGLPVELDVDQDNSGAQRLYTRLGFRRIGATGTDYRMRWASQDLDETLADRT